MTSKYAHWPVPSRCHQKKPIEQRHRTIRSIFLRLKNAKLNVADSIHAIRAISITNDLYGSDKLSAFEMGKGFTKPIHADRKPISVDEELRNAHDELMAKTKLTIILRSNVFPKDKFKIGNIVQIFINDGNAKRCSWTSPRKIISIGTDA